MPNDTKILVEAAVLALKRFTVDELCEYTDLRRPQVVPVLAQLIKDGFLIDAAPDACEVKSRVKHRPAGRYQVTTEVVKRRELADRVYRLRRALAQPQNLQDCDLSVSQVSIKSLEILLEVCDSNTSNQPLTCKQLQVVEQQLHDVYVQLKIATYRQASDSGGAKNHPFSIAESWERWKSCNVSLHRIVDRWKAGLAEEPQEQITLPPKYEESEVASSRFADRTYQSLKRFKSMLDQLRNDDLYTEPTNKVIEDSWQVDIVYSAEYPSQERLREVFSWEFRSYLVGKLNALGYSDVEEMKTKDFEEVQKTGLSERRKAIFCMPYLLPITKYLDEAVIQFGWHRRFGLAYVQRSYGNEVKQNQGGIVVERITFEEIIKKVRKGTSVYFPVNYAIGDIVRAGVARYDNKNEKVSQIKPTKIHDGEKLKRSYRSRPRTTKVTDHIRIPEDVINHAIDSGETWAYAFDLGDLESVKVSLKHLRNNSKYGLNFRDVKIVVVEHNEKIPVGIGFNIYAAPLLLRSGLWKMLHDAVQEYLTPEIVNELEQIGVDVSASTENDAGSSIKRNELSPIVPPGTTRH